MAIRFEIEKHGVCFPSKTLGSEHELNMILAEDTDNGTVVGVGDYQSFDNYKTKACPATYKAKILEKAGVNPDTRCRDLTDDEVKRISEVIDADYQVEGDLRREVAMNIKRLQEIGCYRGIRHRKGLPVRGQKTKTNARTRKGPKRTVANKKK